MASEPHARRPGAPVYRLHGLRVASEVPLAGAVPEERDWDVEVRWGPSGDVPAVAAPGRVVATRARRGGYWYVATEAGGETTLRVPGICDFVVAAGATRVECRPAPAVDPAAVGLLVGGLVLAFLLGRRGDVVLHASAVEAGGTAVALAGDSGAGKSTLAAVLCAAGARLITDDLLRVGAGAEGDVRCIGGAPQLRLRRHAAWAMEGLAGAPPASPTVDDRLGVEPATSAHETVPLATVALVRPSRSASRLEIEELAPALAVVRLAALLRIAAWKDPAVLRRQFATLAWMARSLRVVDAVVPWGPPLPAGVAPSLLALARPRGRGPASGYAAGVRGGPMGQVHQHPPAPDH